MQPGLHPSRRADALLRMRGDEPGSLGEDPLPGIPTLHGVVFDTLRRGRMADGGEGHVNPFDSWPILIRLGALPDLKELALKTPLVPLTKTSSSAPENGMARDVA